MDDMEPYYRAYNILMTVCAVVILLSFVGRFIIWMDLLPYRLIMKRYGKLTWWDILKEF